MNSYEIDLVFAIHDGPKVIYNYNVIWIDVVKLQQEQNVSLI